MLGGDIGAIQQAIETGTSQAGEMLVDSLVLANIHPSVLPAISGLNSVDKRQAVGIVETWSVAACISAADRAVKGSNVTTVRVHMAFGIGGKCYMVVAGDVSDVNNAVTVASESAGEKGLLVYRSVIRARMKPCGDRWWRDNGKTADNGSHDSGIRAGETGHPRAPDCQSRQRSL